MSRVWPFEAHSCTSSKRSAQITLLSKVPACFHFRLVHLHLGQQGELPTDPLLLLIWTTKRPWNSPPQWNIEPSYRTFPLSTITLALSLISCLKIQTHLVITAESLSSYWHYLWVMFYKVFLWYCISPWRRNICLSCLWVLPETGVQGQVQKPLKLIYYLLLPSGPHLPNIQVMSYIIPILIHVSILTPPFPLVTSNLNNFKNISCITSGSNNLRALVLRGLIKIYVLTVYRYWRS